MKNKGIAIILDSFIALIFVLVVLSVYYGLSHAKLSQTSGTEFKKLHYTSEDVLDVLNKEGTLDQIGEEWAKANGSVASENWQNASNLTRDYLDKLIPRNMGYKVTIDEVPLYSSDDDPSSTRVPESEAETKTHSARLLVGYSAGLPTRGHVARSFLTKIREKRTSKYAYFGGFVGQGNLIRKITLPSTLGDVETAYIEFAAGSPFHLYVNDHDYGEFTPSGEEMAANIKDEDGYLPSPWDHFHSGENEVEIKFSSSDISEHYLGGGFIKVTYNTSEMETIKDEGKKYYYFPGIEGLINLYSSFYVPGDLNEMNIKLKLKTNNSGYFNIGNVQVLNFTGNESNQTFLLNNTYLESKLGDGELSYTDLSEKTIPIRLGTRNISINVSSELDIAIVNDRSGSMRQSGWTLDKTINPSYVFDDVVVPRNGWSSTYDFDVPADTERLAVAINWSRIPGLSGSEGSEFVVNLKRPGDSWIFRYPQCPGYCDGTTCANDKVDPPDSIGGADEYYSGICTKPQILLVGNPPVGTWEVAVYGWNLRPTASPPSSQNVTIEIYNGSSSEIIRNPTVLSNEAAKNASKNFVDGMYPDDRGAYIKFGDYSVLAQDLTSDKDALKTAIDNTGLQGGTAIETGINEATNELLNNGRENATRIMILLTDGQNDAGPSPVLSAAENAKNNNITIFTIGLTGFVNKEMLEEVATKPEYYHYAPDASHLPDIYSEIQKTITASYRSQTIGIEKFIPHTLYPESYINFSYTPQNLSAFGQITLTQNTGRFNDTENCSGEIFVTESARVVDAKITSYSAEHWTDFMSINGEVVYSLRDGSYGDDYLSLGDPFTVQIPNPSERLTPGQINEGEIRTGNSPDENTGCSGDNRAIFTIRLNGRVGYGDVFLEKLGCNWKIQFEDNSYLEAKIPEDYAGDENCSYTATENITYNQQDAIDDAIYRLLQKLDSNENKKLDIKFNPDMIEFHFSRAGGVRSLWGPIVLKLVVWM